MKRLTDIPTGVESKIIDLIPSDDIIKIMSMGFFPNKQIKVVRKGFFDNPLYVIVDGISIALTKEEAKSIIVYYED